MKIILAQNFLKFQENFGGNFSCVLSLKKLNDVSITIQKPFLYMIKGFIYC